MRHDSRRMIDCLRPARTRMRIAALRRDATSILVALLLLLSSTAVMSPVPSSAVPVDSGSVTSALQCVTFVDGSTGFAAGAAGTIIKTTNAGLTWRVVRSGDSHDFRGISFADSLHGWVVSKAGWVLTTSDGGENWTVASEDLGTESYAVENIYDVELISATTGFAVGGAQDTPPMAWGSYASGAGWGVELWAGKYEPPPEMPPYPQLGLGEFYAIDYVGTTRGWAVGSDRYNGANKPAIWDYDDARSGQKWVVQSVTGVGPLYDVSFANASTGVTVGSGGKIYRTTNGGTTWTTVTSPVTTDLSGVVLTASGAGWAVGASGRILATSDFGASWTQQVSGTSYYLEDIASLGGAAAVAVGRSGTVRYTTDGTTWQSPPAPPAVTFLFSPTHPADEWSALPTATFTWSASGDVVGYGTAFDQVADTSPSVLTTTATSAQAVATESGAWYFHVRAKDSLGRWSAPRHTQILVDLDAPQVSSDVDSGGYEDSATVTIVATDAHSGPGSITYSVDGGLPVTVPGSIAAVEFSEPATYSLSFRAADVAGNMSATETASVVVRESVVIPDAPVMVSLTSSTHPMGEWSADAAATFAWSATGDITGYGTVFDRSASTSPSVVTTTATTAQGIATESGAWYYHVTAKDSLERWSAPKHRQILVDLDAPQVSSDVDLGGYESSATVAITATDAHSGADSLVYSVEGSTPVTVADSIAVVHFSEPATYTLSYHAADVAGNVSATETVSVVVRAPYVPPPPPEAQPVQGADRYLTALAACDVAFPGIMPLGPDGHRTVVIASGRNWPDALAAAGLAGALGAPLLLTQPDELPSAVSDRIGTLGADRAIIVGGPAAVGSSVGETLEDLLGIGNVRTIAGATRYETANAIAAESISVPGRPAWDGSAFVATGGNFPDALAAGPLAAAEGWPLYLANPDGIAPTTIAAMQAAGVQRVYLLGGTAAVSDASRDAISAAGIVIAGRWYGSSRYATAVRIAEESLSRGLVVDSVALATGVNFPDALAGGVMQGLTGSVLLLTRGDVLSPEPGTFLEANASEVREVRFLGGIAALSQAVRDDAMARVLP